MFVLTRKIDQTIVIGGNTTVVVLGIDRGSIKLGFQAPDDVGIHPGEQDPEDISHKPQERDGGMWVTTRKVKGSGVVIGSNILVKILGQERNRVKVGIEAPSDVRIERGELVGEGIEGRAHRSKERL